MVHAGLDILRSSITARDDPNAVILDQDKIELIEQIFSASGSSIDILDDLVVYEHIDSGDAIALRTPKSIFLRALPAIDHDKQELSSWISAGNPRVPFLAISLRGHKSWPLKSL